MLHQLAFLVASCIAKADSESDYSIPTELPTDKTKRDLTYVSGIAHMGDAGRLCAHIPELLVLPVL